eukprot:8191611-Pyramimonas_sp.AAC.1
MQRQRAAAGLIVEGLGASHDVQTFPYPFKLESLCSQPTLPGSVVPPWVPRGLPISGRPRSVGPTAHLPLSTGGDSPPQKR